MTEAKHKSGDKSVYCDDVWENYNRIITASHCTFLSSLSISIQFIQSNLWMLMAWYFIAKASVTTVLSTLPRVSSC